MLVHSHIVIHEGQDVAPSLPNTGVEVLRACDLPAVAQTGNGNDRSTDVEKLRDKVGSFLPTQLDWGIEEEVRPRVCFSLCL